MRIRIQIKMIWIRNTAENYSWSLLYLEITPGLYYIYLETTPGLSYIYKLKYDINFYKNYYMK